MQPVHIPLQNNFACLFKKKCLKFVCNIGVGSVSIFIVLAQDTELNPYTVIAALPCSATPRRWWSALAGWLPDGALPADRREGQANRGVLLPPQGRLNLCDAKALLMELLVPRM